MNPIFPMLCCPYIFYYHVICFVDAICANCYYCYFVFSFFQWFSTFAVDLLGKRIIFYALLCNYLKYLRLFHCCENQINLRCSSYHCAFVFGVLEGLLLLFVCSF